MAPQGRPAKRPAAAASAKVESAAKRPANGATKTCALVSKAVNDAAGYSPEVLSMLTGSLPQCLGEVREARHPFQARIVEMIGEVLQSCEARHQAALTSADEAFGKVQADRASREAEQASREAVAAESARAEEAAEAALEASAVALQSARDVLSQAEQEQQAGDAELEAAAAKLATLTSTRTEVLEPLREGTAEKLQASVHALTKVCQDFSFDASLLCALPGAAAKAPGERSPFDSLVLQEAEVAFRTSAEALAAAIEAGDAAKAERAAKVAAAAAEAARAAEAEQAGREAVRAAKAERKEADLARRAAAKAVSALGQELKRVGGELQRANAGLEDFRAGPFASYRVLVERTAQPPQALEAQDAVEAAAEPAMAAVGAAPAA